MGVPTKKARFSPGRDHKLTDKQRVFVAEYVIDMNATRAAVAAGYSPKTAASMGCQLLDHKAYPLVAVAVKKALADKELRAEKKADDVLRYIHTAMWYQPLMFFLPGDDGGWLIDEDKVATLPPCIGCLIEEVERRTVVIGEGANRKEVTKFWVRLVSKTAAMTLAAKHQLGEKAPAPVPVGLDWCGSDESQEERAMAEARKLVEVALPQPGLMDLAANGLAQPVHRLECRPTRNGYGHG
jgi:Terminase small subunit